MAETGDSSSEALARAIHHYQSGEPHLAAAICQRILEAAPGDPDANHLLGLIAFQMGKHELAVRLMEAALAATPRFPAALQNLGMILMSLGRVDEAITAYRRALEFSPDEADLRFDLGVALHLSGDLDGAAAAYAAAIDLRPDHPRAHNNLGALLMSRDRLTEAEPHLREATETDPELPDAWNNLGLLLKKSGFPDQAVAPFQRALELNPRNAELLNNLGGSYEAMGDMEEAAKCYLRAIDIDPTCVDALLNLGYTAHARGMKGEAIAAYRRVLAIDPGRAEAYRFIAMVKRYTDHDDDLVAMESLYSRTELAQEQRCHLAFALGKAHEELGEYEKAFAFLEEGNRLRRLGFEFSIAEERNRFDTIRSVYSPDFLAAHRDGGERDETPIFIVGMPRSGTSLVEQILAAHPGIFGAGESLVLGRIADALCVGDKRGPLGCIADLPDEAFRDAGRRYLERVRRFAGDAPRITDKMPQNFLHIGLIKAALPDARIIHCLRDPLATCLSIYRNYFSSHHPYAYDQRELGKYYNLYRELMTYWHTALPAGSIYDIRYEELIADQEGETRRLLEHCGLEWDTACLAFHRSDRAVNTISIEQVRQPIYTDSLAFWRNYEAQLRPLRKALAEDDA